MNQIHKREMIALVYEVRRIAPILRSLLTMDVNSEEYDLAPALPIVTPFYLTFLEKDVFVNFVRNEMQCSEAQLASDVNDHEIVLMFVRQMTASL